MPDTPLQRRREELARLEVGQTRVRPWLAWILIAHFVPVICAVPIIQAVYDDPRSQSGPGCAARVTCTAAQLAASGHRAREGTLVPGIPRKPSTAK